MRSTIFKRIFFLFIFFASFFCEKIIAQQALTTLQKSSSPNMMMMSNSSRYASYQHFSYWVGLYGDSLNILNPYWLGSILPSQNVRIATQKHNLIFTNGNIFSWATDTTSGGWIMQGYLDPTLSGGVGQWGARNYLTGKRYGITFSGATGTTVWGYPALYLANNEVQDSILNDSYTYVPTIQPGNTRTGAINYVREDSLNTTWLKTKLPSENVFINTAKFLSLYNGGDSIHLQAGSIYKYGSQAIRNNYDAGLNFYGIYDGFDEYRYAMGSGQQTTNFFRSNGSVASPTAMGNGNLITEHHWYAYGSSFQDAFSIFVWGKMSGSTVLGATVGLGRNLDGNNSITNTVIYFDTQTKDITETGYPNTRDDTGTPANMLYTTSTGLQQSKLLSSTFAFCNTTVSEATNLGIGVASVNLNTTSNFNGDATSYTIGANSIRLLKTGVYTLTVQLGANFSAGDELTIAPTLTGGSVGSTIQTLSFAVPTAANYGNTFTFPIRVITAPTTLTVAISRTATIAAESVNATISLNKNY